MPKNDLNNLLDNKPPRIKKPKGLTISTDLEEQTESTSAQVQEGTNALVQKDTKALMPESTNVLVHKDTSAQVHKSTNAEMQEDTSAVEHKDTSAVERENTSAQMQKSTNAPAKDPRPSKGYKIRTDIADACKLLAVLQKRKMYEVMEEGLLMYLRQQGVDIS